MSTIYSVFVPEEGVYKYYESAKNVAVNADLPVPQLGSDAGKIGVPAMDAARRLPGDAKLVGQGWQARGIIASKGGRPLAGLGDDLVLFTPGQLFVRVAVPVAVTLAVAVMVFPGLRKKWK